MSKAPLIKIQGIKTKLVPFIAHSISWYGGGRWIEPFAGSGAVLFNLAPQRAIAADANEHLIRIYQEIQRDELTAAKLRVFLEREGRALKDRGEVHYYEIRTRFNETHSPYDFIFLNRACFNGIVRFNLKGKFNVPFCRKPERFAPAYITKICNQAAWISGVMRGKDWLFVAQDWRTTLKQAKADDFIYLDPPYNDRHADYFNKWNAGDADDLANTVKQISSGFAYSTWKQNRYRVNEHLERHFADYPVLSTRHFYHVGSTENLRGEMEEALVISHKNVAHASPLSVSTEIAATLF